KKCRHSVLGTGNNDGLNPALPRASCGSDLPLAQMRSFSLGPVETVTERYSGQVSLRAAAVRLSSAGSLRGLVKIFEVTRERAATLSSRKEADCDDRQGQSRCEADQPR